MLWDFFSNHQLLFSSYWFPFFKFISFKYGIISISYWNGVISLHCHFYYQIKIEDFQRQNIGTAIHSYEKTSARMLISVIKWQFLKIFKSPPSIGKFSVFLSNPAWIIKKYISRHFCKKKILPMATLHWLCARAASDHLGPFGRNKTGLWFKPATHKCNSKIASKLHP